MRKGKDRPIRTNVNIHYLLPLTYINSLRESELREAKIISSDGGVIRCQAVEEPEKFKIHTFCDEYFQWLIYAGLVIPIEDTATDPSAE